MDRSALQAGLVEVRVWEWPLRVWHWLFAITVSGSLATGLSGEISWMDWHLRFGFVAVGLLLFRLLWGFAGGLYSRWHTYRASPAGMIAYFKGQALQPGRLPTASDAHTAPGAALIVLLLLAVLVQTVTGLFATDEIFTEGPLVRYADESLVSTFTAIHHRAYYLVLAAIILHLLAHLTYAIRRDPLPLAMFSGRKRLPDGLADTPALGIRGLILGAASAALVWVALNALL